MNGNNPRREINYKITTIKSFKLTHYKYSKLKIKIGGLVSFD
jgi:hypothetical protein